MSISGEDSSYFADYKARYLCRLLRRSFSGKVLDFGCGVGVLSRSIKKHLPLARIDGFDVSQDCIAKIDPDLSAQGLFTSASIDLAHDYDLIVVANVMHHVLPAQRTEILQNLADRLCHKGLIFIFEHNPANPVTRWIVKNCPFDDNAILLPPRETAGYIVASGLQLKRRDYIVFMPSFLAWLRPIESRLRWLPMGAQYVTCAEKYVRA